MTKTTLYVVTLLATVATSTAIDLCGGAVDGTTGIIDGGYSHTCARNSLGAVACWGSNSGGQIAHHSDAPQRAAAPGGQGLTGTVAIAAGGDNTCALLDNGGVKCWGRDSNGQLGDGPREGRVVLRNTPVDVKNLTDAVAIATGHAHTCAVLSTGGVKCWGWNNIGQLGDNSTTDRHTPVAVLALTDAVAIAAGGEHTCALLSTGGAKCWGGDSNGQLGDGGSENTHTKWGGGYENTPVDVKNLTDAVAIATGGDHTCAVLSTGQVKCWGSDSNGQLGDGASNNTHRDNFNSGYEITPVAVLGIDNAVAIAAGFRHTCAVLSTGGVKCWGSDSNGQLGDGGANTDKNTPVDVKNLTDAVAIATGGEHTCAVLRDGRLKCWGLDDYGQLGDGGANTDKNTPVDVLNFDACFQTITAPFYSTSPGIHLKDCDIVL